jgi:hypothetical protein
MTVHLYEDDFFAWAAHTAELLKHHRFDDIDIPNLVEEIEDMGKNISRGLYNRLVVLLAHLLKWHYQPQKRSRSWKATLDIQRYEIRKLLKKNHSLKSKIDEEFIDAYQAAIFQAVIETEMHQFYFPQECPWSLENTIDDDFYPD